MSELMMPSDQACKLIVPKVFYTYITITACIQETYIRCYAPTPKSLAEVGLELLGVRLQEKEGKVTCFL